MRDLPRLGEKESRPGLRLQKYVFFFFPTRNRKKKQQQQQLQHHHYTFMRSTCLTVKRLRLSTLNTPNGLIFHPPPPPVPTMKDFLRLRREQMKPTFVPSETENVIFLFISPFSVCLFLLPTSSDCLLASFPFLFSSHPALHICPFRLCLLTLTTSLCPLIAFRSVSSGRTEQKT